MTKGATTAAPHVVGGGVATSGANVASPRQARARGLAFELVAADVSGDLAYTVGYEHSSRSLDGGPIEPSTLRVTHVYRREGGEWKIVHRHGDFVPVDQSPPAEASKA